MLPLSPLSISLLLSLLLLSLSLSPLCFAGMDLTNYVLTWDQDFTLLSNLSVSANGPCGPGGSTWMAHTPYYGDWARFLDPTADFEPFHLGNGGPLTIRSQRQGNSNDLYAGLLASVDPKGRGFSQRYGVHPAPHTHRSTRLLPHLTHAAPAPIVDPATAAVRPLCAAVQYFEMRARLPSGLGTWPAFWLEDVVGLVNASMGHHEIDILEEYGNNVGILHTTQHWWGDVHWANFSSAGACSMTTGMHTYGIDIQPDSLTYYYDRTLIWQAPSSIPSHGTYDRPMYVMVNLAYGGGGDDNNVSYILDHPQDMAVEYVRVWQGSGGSKRAADISDAPAVTFWNYPPQFSLQQGAAMTISGVSLSLRDDGRLAVLNSQQRVLWMSGGPAHVCNGTCVAAFQNDGNLVFRDDSGPYWSAGTYGRNAAILTLQNTPPYLLISDTKCNTVWTTENVTVAAWKGEVEKQQPSRAVAEQ